MKNHVFYLFVLILASACATHRKSTDNITSTKIEEEKQEIIAKGDPFCHYYVSDSKKANEKKSVCSTQEVDGKSLLILYAPDGTETYQFQQVNLSYHQHAEIKHKHPNGAIAEISVHLNPGASMYMYETTYYFDTENQPLRKVSSKYPSTLEEMMDAESLWDKETKSWKKRTY